MNIIISDYKETLETDYTVTKQSILDIIPKANIKILPFLDTQDYWNQIYEADGLITAFLPLNKDFLQYGKKLKVISLSSVGYGTVDLMEAEKLNIGVCHIREYCTREVAEHTIALMMSLNSNLKYYTEQIENKNKWQYHSISPLKNINQQTISIFGFGKIGKEVAKIAKGLGMKVLVIAPRLTDAEAIELGVEKVSKEEGLTRGDVITNHMNLRADNQYYFDKDTFDKMKKDSIFLNLGRGGSVKEEDLIEALDLGKIRGAGLDVLEEENPDLSKNLLIGRDNVIITPHSAFYSKASLEKLQRISGMNLGYFLKGEFEKVDEIINK